MENVRKGSHSIHQLHVHIVWRTKYRFGVLRGVIQLRCREIIPHTCDAMDVRIMKRVVSKDHIHLYVSYPTKVSISDLVKRIKGRSARKLLDEFSEFKKRYWCKQEIDLLMETVETVKFSNLCFSPRFKPRVRNGNSPYNGFNHFPNYY